MCILLSVDADQDVDASSHEVCKVETKLKRQLEYFKKLLGGYVARVYSN